MSFRLFFAGLRPLLFLLPLCLCGCGGVSTADIPAVKPFDLEKYLGKWHEAARLPVYFEDGMSEVTADYSRTEQGDVEVVNSGVRDGKRTSIRGVARFAGSPDVGELEVSFFRPFYSPYRIIFLEEDYSAAIVTSETKDYLWILTRSEDLAPERRKAYVEFAKRHGFDTEALIWAKP